MMLHDTVFSMSCNMSDQLLTVPGEHALWSLAGSTKHAEHPWVCQQVVTPEPSWDSASDVWWWPTPVQSSPVDVTLIGVLVAIALPVVSRQVTQFERINDLRTESEELKREMHYRLKTMIRSRKTIRSGRPICKYDKSEANVFDGAVLNICFAIRRVESNEWVSGFDEPAFVYIRRRCRCCVILNDMGTWYKKSATGGG